MSAKVAKGNVDIVEDLDMVAEETNGLDYNGRVTFLAQTGEGGFHGRTDPGSAGHALALKGEKPVRSGEPQRSETSGHVGRGPLGFHRVGVRVESGCALIIGRLRLDSSARHAVCREKHGRLHANSRSHALPDRLQPVGERLSKERVIGPAIDEVHLDAGGFRKGGAAI